MGKRALATGLFFLFALSLGVPAALAGGGCHDTEFKDSRGVSVDLVSACFSPTVIRIQPGQRVTWTNQDSMAHTVTGAGYRWGSTNELGLNQTVSFRFGSSGVYPYFCLFHPGMVGAVVVGDGASSATTSEDVVPVINTPAPIATAPQPVSRPAASHGVSAIWRVAAIASFALLLGVAAILGTRLVTNRTRRAPAGA
jgi:plastocyanin